jgi:adenosine deaminase
MSEIRNFIEKMPKAELHLHIEGTFEPELIFDIAQRNGVKLKYDSAEALRKAYDFNNLQEFLDIYYQGAQVLLKEQDFYDLTMAYIKKVNEQNVRHIEIFFDPQTHTDRGVDFDVVINGIYNALKDGEKEYGITFALIMSYLRHLSEEEAFKTLEQSLPHKDKILGVGLDSSELGNPPSKFVNVFNKSRELGYLTFAHAGEEGPSEYVKEATALLDITRIDHGNRCLDDEELTKHIAEKKIPLTVCPLSNLKLKVVDDLKNHPLKKMMDKGLFVTVNSDDPSYFGGYVNENYIAVQEALNLSKQDIYTLAKNSFEASVISDDLKKKYISELDKTMNEG